MADKKASDAAQALLKSFQETNQVITEGMEVLKTHQNVAQSIVAAQERNMKFFQGFFAEGMEALKNQAESARSLMQELGQKTQEQQSMANYLDFLQAPLSTYQKSVEAAQAATRQMPDAMQKANE
jgi:DNA repair protein RadC